MLGRLTCRSCYGDAAHRIQRLTTDNADLLAACQEAHRRGAHQTGPHDTGSRPEICWLCDSIAKAKGDQ